MSTIKAISLWQPWASAVAAARISFARDEQFYIRPIPKMAEPTTTEA